jgi:repressor LexA
MQVLQFVLDYQAQHGISPLLEEMARHFNVSTVTIFEHLKALEKKGAIVRKKHASRSIEVIDPRLSPNSLSLPLLGYIAAGEAIEAIEQHETFQLSDIIPSDDNHFVLQVQGNSMIDDGIHDSDYVIVRKGSMARNGQTVVAIIGDNEATLKKFYHEGDRIRLQPANEALSAIYVKDCEIRGIVVGIFRTY